MKVLIVKTSSLGDIVHSFPVVEYLKCYYPKVEIHWVVESSFSTLLESHPEISKVIKINTRQWRKGLFSYQTHLELSQFFRELRCEVYDLIIDLQGNTKSGLITASAKSKEKIGFGFKSVPEVLNLLATNKRYNLTPFQNVREDYLELVKKHLSNSLDFTPRRLQLQISDSQKSELNQILQNIQIYKENCLMVCPGANWKNKQLNIDTLIGFLKKVKIYENNCFLLLVWGNEFEKELCKKIDQNFPNQSLIVEKLDLPLLQNLMSYMKKVIAMDSLPLHLAASAAVPTFAVFGPSSAKKYGPLGSCQNSYQGSCPYNKKFEKRCPILRTCQSGACIKNATIDALFNAYICS